jgi:hypothetical protein
MSFGIAFQLESKTKEEALVVAQVTLFCPVMFHMSFSHAHM